MATPVWVQFSMLPATIEQTIYDLIPTLHENECKLYRVSRLGFDPYEEGFGFAGDLSEGDTVKCSAEEEAINLAKGWVGFCLSYKVISVSSYIHIYFWRAESNLCLALEINESILYFKSDSYEEGQWLEKFLRGMTASTMTEVCTYGGYEVIYKPIDTHTFVLSLQNGSLFMKPYPSFNMISQRSISEEAVLDLLATRRRRPRMKYYMTTTGYHVFSNLR